MRWSTQRSVREGAAPERACLPAAPAPRARAGCARPAVRAAARARRADRRASPRRASAPGRAGSDPGGVRLRAGSEENVAHCESPLPGQPEDELAVARGLVRPDAAWQLGICADGVGDRNAEVRERLDRSPRGPDATGTQSRRRPVVPEDGQQHVRRSAQLRRRLVRVDQHEAVVGLERERADVLLPLCMPRRPAAQASAELLQLHGS